MTTSTQGERISVATTIMTSSSHFIILGRQVILGEFKWVVVLLRLVGILDFIWYI